MGMNLRATPFLGLSLAAVFLAAPAYSHISLEQAGTHLSRYGDGEIKAGPCGRSGGTRGTHVYMYEPGQTITISLIETIPHPSYFRWAFDADGDSAFKEPASIKPIDPKRPCPIDNGDHCGASDFYNNAAVLPLMDDLNPHMAGASGTKYTWQVTLPNVECTNCTLQVIQVMEDNQFHGDYDPTPGVGVEDIYHQCIDLVLKRSTPGEDSGAPPGGGLIDSGEPDQPDASGGTPGGGTPGGGTPGGGTPGGGVHSDGGGSSSGADGGASANDASPESGGCAASPLAPSRGALAFGSVLGMALLGVMRRRRARASR